MQVFIEIGYKFDTHESSDEWRGGNAGRREEGDETTNERVCSREKTVRARAGSGVIGGTLLRVSRSGRPLAVAGFVHHRLFGGQRATY